jgi:hypothetical protein
MFTIVGALEDLQSAPNRERRGIRRRYPGALDKCFTLTAEKNDTAWR